MKRSRKNWCLSLTLTQFRVRTGFGNRHWPLTAEKSETSAKNRETASTEHYSIYAFMQIFGLSLEDIRYYSSLFLSFPFLVSVFRAVNIM